MESRLFILNGRRARVWSGGAGPALLLLHGGIGDAEQHWHAVWHELSRTHTVLAPDLPGMGESEAVSTLDWETMFTWLDSLLDAHDVKVVDCVGNSFGASLARLYAANRPERVRSAALVNGGMVPIVPAFAKRLMRTRRWLWSPLDWVSRNVLYSRFGLGLMLHEKSVISDAFVSGAQRQGKGFSALMLGLFTSTLPVRLVAARPPRLLWGADDRSAPRKIADRIARETAADAPSMLSGSGHMPQLETPAQFVAALERALS